MQLPIDIKALINEATDINAAREMELSVSLYVDEAAPADLVAHVRSTFTSSSEKVRMTVAYLDKSFVPHAGDDFAIIVADGSAVVGPAATALRAAGVPVMVVTTTPEALKASTERIGHSVPDLDLVTPEVEQDAKEPYALHGEESASLDERMGSWIVSVCHEKRLALSIAFPFMRRPLARDAVQATSLQNAGIGLVPIIPGADLPIMTLNQAKMLLQIAAAYGHEMDKGRAKELVAVVGGAYACRVLARELIELVPVLGFIIRPGIAYGGTSAVGYAAINYFEGGEDAAGVLNAVTHAREAGARFVSKLRSLSPDSLSDLLGKATDLSAYIPVAESAVAEYGPKVVSLAKDVKDSVGAQVGAVRRGVR